MREKTFLLASHPPPLPALTQMPSRSSSRYARNVGRMVCVSLPLSIIGCSASAVQQWGLHSPDAAPRVTRITTQVPTLAVEGPIYVEGELVVAERPAGSELRSGALLSGYRFAFGEGSKNPVTLGLMGRLGWGKPALLYENRATAVFGAHGELTFPLTPPIDPHDEKVEFVWTKLETVVGFDASLFTKHDPFDFAGGVGLRFTLGTEVAPPVLRWLGTLF